LKISAQGVMPILMNLKHGNLLLKKNI